MLRAPWKKIVCTPTDISVKTHLTPAMIKADRSQRHSARALSSPVSPSSGPGADIMWDELAAAAWIDPISDHKERDSLYGG